VGRTPARAYFSPFDNFFARYDRRSARALARQKHCRNRESERRRGKLISALFNFMSVYTYDVVIKSRLDSSEVKSGGQDAGKTIEKKLKNIECKGRLSENRKTCNTVLCQSDGEFFYTESGIWNAGQGKQKIKCRICGFETVLKRSSKFIPKNQSRRLVSGGQRELLCNGKVQVS
jgi:hypothetical protein